MISTFPIQRAIMNGFSVIRLPDDDFWSAYTELWDHASVKSPFQAPALLQFLSELPGMEVYAMTCRTAGKLTASVLFQKNHKTLRFLSDKKTDSNFFMFRHGITEEQYRSFFDALFAECRKRKWNLVLNHIPDWAIYNDILEECGRKSGLYWMRLPYSVCPVMEATHKSPSEMAMGNYEIRRRINRLRKMNARFETFEKDEDLEGWLNDFTEAHILRWQHTDTPSAFRNRSKIQFMLGCMKAWASHHLMVRVSVVLNNKRIGFLLGLIEGNKIIHHSTTYHPDYAKLSPGLAVLGIMTEWMTIRGIRVFDFGDGNEAYKYILAQRDQPVSRIFASSKYNMGFMLRSFLIRYIRNNKKLYRIYSERIRKLFRH